mmetsp:Transcript_53300/g.61093  ORF Transcript_53300/g.61093 Transcript_53300/m.61093 type:complete len:80 (-) Transcript_53300:685-924(-)
MRAIKKRRHSQWALALRQERKKSKIRKLQLSKIENGKKERILGGKTQENQHTNTHTLSRFHVRTGFLDRAYATKTYGIQ